MVNNFLTRVVSPFWGFIKNSLTSGQRQKNSKSPKNSKNENSLLNMYKINQFYDADVLVREITQFLGIKKYLHFPQKGLMILIRKSQCGVPLKPSATI